MGFIPLTEVDGLCRRLRGWLDSSLQDPKLCVTVQSDEGAWKGIGIKDVFKESKRLALLVMSETNFDVGD
jgi:hypothetical protein